MDRAIDDEEQLNEFLHGLLGYETGEDAASSVEDSSFQLALDTLANFEDLHGVSFIAAKWKLRIESRLGKNPNCGESSARAHQATTPSDREQSSVQAEIVEEIQRPPAKAIPAWQRYLKSMGGSSSTVKTKKTKPRSRSDLKLRAYDRAITKLGGIGAVTELRQTWASLDTGYGGLEWEQSEGLIMALIHQGLSQKEIRATLPVGGYKCSRIKVAIENGFTDFHTRRPRQVSSHAVTKEQLKFLQDDVGCWPSEDGFPCAHRRPRTYHTEENISWTKLHARYNAKATAASVRVLSLSRWKQYVHFYYPGLRLSRSKEDVCDSCVRIETELLRTDITDELRCKLLLEKQMHIDAAVGQRQTMSKFIRLFVEKVDPKQVLPNQILPDCIDSGQRSVDKAEPAGMVDLNLSPIPTVLVQAEDYGGSLPLPHYGFQRPAADYFNSNLMIHQFVTSNLSDNTNRVTFYDERGQGKGADALCSLRIRNLLFQLDTYKARGTQIPSYLINVMDNCVGQNKSHVVMKFFALVSLLLFEKVVLLYLIPGHSHMVADRVVAWCKGALRNINIYSPVDMAKACDKVKGVSAEFLDHTDAKRPFYIMWEGILDKYFKNLPSGFTQNYFFEFDEGIVTMKHLANSPDSESVCTPMILPGTASTIRSVLLQELFGLSALKNLTGESIDSIQLPRHPGIDLSRKKLLSLSKKYFSIPLEYRPYFPSGEGIVDDEQTSDAGVETQQPDVIKKRAKVPKDAVGMRKPGRPKKVAPPLANQKSILTFFAGGSNQ